MRYRPEIFRVSFWWLNESLCEISRSFDDGKVDFQNLGFCSFWSVNYKPDELSQKIFAISCLHIKLDIWWKFHVHRPCSSWDIRGVENHLPQMLLSCQKQQMLLTVNRWLEYKSLKNKFWPWCIKFFWAAVQYLTFSSNV